MTRSITILVVHCEKSLLSVFSLLLAFEGYKVLTATSGKSGFEKYLSGKPDLVMAASRMAPEPGIWLVENIRKSDETTPIMLLSTFGTLQARIDFFKTGGDDYFDMPFKVDDFFSRVKALLDLGPQGVKSRRQKINDLINSCGDSLCL